jgi:sarcosine oxidase subunit gamma
VTATSDISPLAAWQGKFAAFRDAAVDLRLREVPSLTQILLRIDPQSPGAATIRQALDIDLPDTFGTYTQSGDLDALWLGPDEWLLVAPPGAAAVLQTAVAQAAGQTHHMVIDVSANRTCIELRGADARYVLAKGCHEDFTARSFCGRRVVQTVLAKVPVILQLTADVPVFRVFPRNSFAAHLARWLLDASDELIAARCHGHDDLQGRFAPRQA